MSTYPLISILIPVYNTEKFLAGCLDSVLRQTYANIEIVAVNDGSSDRSSAILHEYAARDPRLRVFDKPNEGVMLARKMTIEEARGEYLLFVDSDDYISPATVEILYNTVAGGSYDIASAKIIRVKRSLRTVFKGKLSHSLERLDLIRLMLLDKAPRGLIGKLYRRRLFDGIEYYPEITMGEDYLINMQIALRSDFKGMAFCDGAVYYYVQHGGSMVHRRYSFKYEEVFARRLDALLGSDPQTTVRLHNELLVFQVMRVLPYICHSGLPWAGDRPLVKKAYDAVCGNPKDIRRQTPPGTSLIIKSYRRRFMLLVRFIAVANRWRESVRKRLRNRHMHPFGAAWNTK